jgi:hypothetical protein
VQFVRFEVHIWWHLLLKRELHAVTLNLTNTPLPSDEKKACQKDNGQLGNEPSDLQRAWETVSGGSLLAGHSFP